MSDMNPQGDDYNLTTSAKRKFHKECEQVADEQGLDVYFYDSTDKPDAFEDDGNLHIHKSELRAAFAIGQDVKKSYFNETVVGILAALKLEKYIGERTLWGDHYENDDEDY